MVLSEDLIYVYLFIMVSSEYKFQGLTSSLYIGKRLKRAGSETNGVWSSGCPSFWVSTEHKGQLVSSWPQVLLVREVGLSCCEKSTGFGWHEFEAHIILCYTSHFIIGVSLFFVWHQFNSFDLTLWRVYTWRMKPNHTHLGEFHCKNLGNSLGSIWQQGSEKSLNITTCLAEPLSAFRHGEEGCKPAP